jgi:formylglycine-generating enzyme required for sulfatase activity
VSWDDTQSFLHKLGSISNKPYRLPTEAEWEYAARSGGKKENWSGMNKEDLLEEYAWYLGNSEKSSRPVGMKKPNGLGLYDMTGNVWEWCADWYGEKSYYISSRDNPLGPITGLTRVLRGGSWENEPWYLRVTSRLTTRQDFSSSQFGFRVVLSVQQAVK